MAGAWRTFQATIPLSFDLPGGVGAGIVEEVLAGEYESGFSGTGLRILDIGANVGAFSLWAVHRWPGSTVDAIEANPATFPLLARNVGRYPMIRPRLAAVYPTDAPEIELFARGVADGQAGVAAGLRDTFTGEALAAGRGETVAVLHPADLPPADIVKIDVEGAEADIVAHADFSAASLLLLEFQHDRNLARIKACLAPRFDLILEQAAPWSAILATDSYRATLAGDHYGLAYFLRRGQTRLWQPGTTAQAPGR